MSTRPLKRSFWISGIGACANLTNVRVVQNALAELPGGILHLADWRGGKLQELLVDRNPLVLPSLTAFEMGGLRRAFGVLEEELRKRRQAA